jgi:hypothetical protein
MTIDTIFFHGFAIDFMVFVSILSFGEVHIFASFLFQSKVQTSSMLTNSVSTYVYVLTTLFY